MSSVWVWRCMFVWPLSWLIFWFVPFNTATHCECEKQTAYALKNKQIDENLLKIDEICKTLLIMY